MQPRSLLAATLAVMVMALLASCARTPPQHENWPQGLPPVDHYASLYRQDDANQAVQSRENYLQWVVRFYEGWKLYQDGWNQTTHDVLYGVADDERRQRLAQKMARLGKLLSGEWAKNSSGRRIRSRELSIWGEALLASMKRGDEEKLIDAVTHDAQALLAGRLESTDIMLKRY